MKRLLILATLLVLPVAAQFTPPSGGGTLPASANGVSTDSSSKASASTAHNTSVPLQCSPAGASGTAYTCSTTPSFTPAAKDLILFCPDVANTGAATLVVNSQAGTPAIQKQQGQAALIANDLRASPACVTAEFNGTNWVLDGQTGNAATGLVTSVGGQTGAVGGGWILLEQHTAAASAELDFTVCPANASYDQYAFTLTNITVGTNAANILFEVSSNGGSTYDTGTNYRYGIQRVDIENSPAPASSGNSSIAGIPILAAPDVSGILSTATPGLDFTGYLYGLNNSAVGSVMLHGQGVSWLSVNSVPYSFTEAALYKLGASINAFRFIPSSGTFSGIARCYGIAKQ